METNSFRVVSFDSTLNGCWFFFVCAGFTLVMKMSLILSLGASADISRGLVSAQHVQCGYLSLEFDLFFLVRSSLIQVCPSCYS